MSERLINVSELPAQTKHRPMMASYGEPTLYDVTDTRLRTSASNDPKHLTLVQGGPISPQSEGLWAGKLLRGNSGEEKK